MPLITLQFVAEDDPISLLIRRATFSDFSHVDLVLPDGHLLGARAVGGVEVRTPDYSKFSVLKRMACEVTQEQQDAYYSYARAQIGKPYDFEAIVNFLIQRNWRDEGAWYCSELQAACAEKMGQPFLNPSTDVDRITPRDLTLSLALTPAQ